MQKANFAENEASFVTRSGIYATNVLTAKNQAVTNPVKWRLRVG